MLSTATRRAHSEQAFKSFFSFHSGSRVLRSGFYANNGGYLTGRSNRSKNARTNESQCVAAKNDLQAQYLHYPAGYRVVLACVASAEGRPRLAI